MKGAVAHAVGLVNELEVGLMDECRRRERPAARDRPQPVMGDDSELPIQERHEPVDGLARAASQRAQDVRLRRRHTHRLPSIAGCDPTPGAGRDVVLRREVLLTPHSGLACVHATQNMGRMLQEGNKNMRPRHRRGERWEDDEGRWRGSLRRTDFSARLINSHRSEREKEAQTVFQYLLDPNAHRHVKPFGLMSESGRIWELPDVAVWSGVLWVFGFPHRHHASEAT